MICRRCFCFLVCFFVVFFFPSLLILCKLQHIKMGQRQDIWQANILIQLRINISLYTETEDNQRKLWLSRQLDISISKQGSAMNISQFSDLKGGLDLGRNCSVLSSILFFSTVAADLFSLSFLWLLLCWDLKKMPNIIHVQRIQRN